MTQDELNALATALEEFSDQMTPPPQYVATYTQVEQAPLALAMAILFETVEADGSAE
ncbi:hypothetical protein ACN4EK_10535 [Pantanalinema rosaneae CENA516]|uniref:hypothetical protein n=1 Tax=Pantanalinema rosaneae TaxID=1620701 RepID=UPI003D6EC1A7